jgi:predicted ArsR family transcriptional regulator
MQELQLGNDIKWALQIIIPFFTEWSIPLTATYICENGFYRYNGRMKTSRQRILDYIRLHRYVTAPEIGRVLRMTPANARHHLSVLADQGVVEVVSDRPSGGKGRPAQVFSLTGQTRGGGLEQLTGAALDLIEHGLLGNEANAALRLLAFRLSKERGERDTNGGPLTELDAGLRQSNPLSHMTQRLYGAVSRLNELGYAARWEARSDAPRVILGYCPYAKILADHPQLCRMDEFLLEALLQAPAEQVAKLAHDARGAPYCMFIVRERQKGE